jgi:putative DNA primase/helicase
MMNGTPMLDGAALRFTLFPDLTAHSARGCQLDWPRFVERIRKPEKAYPAKANMPLVKLADFGDARTEKGSLRHDANVTAVGGIEGDYDGGQVTIADAATRLFDYGIRAVLYSSPSSTPEKPRWRVLCPLASPCAPERRREFAGRLNTMLGGVLAPESFALSQAFYIGRSASAAHYEAQDVAGHRFIDEAEEVAPSFPATGTNEAYREGLSAAAEAVNDPVLVALRERNMLLRQSKRGTWAIVCPWKDAHTADSTESATAYLQAGFDGRVNGAGFDCKHSHCAQRSLRDLLDFLGLRCTPDLGGSLQPGQKGPLRDFQGLRLPAHQPTAPNGTATDLAGVELQRGDLIEMRPLRWLWRGYLAAGKLHILAGAPGTGKTTLALALAATVTNGGRWPDGTRAEPGDVLIWSSEDDPDDTLAPRLHAAGAAMSRVRFVRATRTDDGRARPFDPATDFPLLSLTASSLGELRLVLLDPVVTVVGQGNDSHKNSEVRRALNPVVAFAEHHQCALVGISHFSKGTIGRDPVERVTGSLAWAAAARIVIATAKLPEDEGGRRAMVRAKSNIGPDGGGFQFDLDRIEVRPGIEGQRVLWGNAIEGTAREILGTAEQEGEPGGGDAKDFLRDLLQCGSMPATEIFRSGEANGYSKRQMQRACKAIGAKARKGGMREGWVWYMPKVPFGPEDTEDATLSNSAPSASSEPSADYVEF